MGDLKNIEVGGVQQALVVGQVINRLTQEAISTSLIVDIAVRYPGETLYRPFASPVRVIAAGYFVVSGSPLQVLPLNLAPGDTVEFRLNVASPGYMPLEQFEVVSAASITPASTDVVLAGHNLKVDRVPAPILNIKLPLDPIPVGITGLVIDDNDPESPLAGVSIRVIAPDIRPPVMTDNQGRFRIENLPVALFVTLEVELGGAVTTIEHFVDYKSPLNTRMISLNG